MCQMEPHYFNKLRAVALKTTKYGLQRTIQKDLRKIHVTGTFLSDVMPS